MTPHQVQKLVSQLSEESAQRFITEQNAFFNETKYEGFLPTDELMNHYRQYSLAHSNEIILNVSLKYWNWLSFAPLEKDDKFNFHDIITFLTASQNTTLVDWIRFHGQTKSTVLEYNSYRECIEEMNNYINPIVEQFTLGLIDKLLKLEKAISKPFAIDSGNYKNPLLVRK